MYFRFSATNIKNAYTWTEQYYTDNANLVYLKYKTNHAREKARTIPQSILL
jgi:hypothetical protein